MKKLDMQDLLDAMPPGLGSVLLADVSEEHAGALSQLADFDPLRLAAAFAGLLCVPELQSNCLRIETLVHLSLALGRGKRKPNDRLIGQLFTELGNGSLSFQEDPAEDVFVSLVRTPRGNFRILEGLWESAGFYLQRTINVLERIPSKPRFDHIKEAVYALLKLSEAVCARSKLAPYALGNVTPATILTGRVLLSMSSLRRHVRFNDSDLAELEISTDHLGEFGLDPNACIALRTESIGTSTLERYPVAHRHNEYFLLLPTAVSAAIRRYVIDEFRAYGLLDVLAGSLAYEYAELFSGTPLLGSHSGAPLEFRKTDDGVLAGAMTTADRGLFLNFVFFADTLEHFDKEGLMGVYPTSDPAKLDAMIERWVDEAYDQAIKQPGFRECLTIIVPCGIGRAIGVYNPAKMRNNWRYEFIGAPDLLTLSWLEDVTPLSLWRLLDSQEKLAALGVALQNINGLLNMIGWARSLGGHLIPHGSMPESFALGDAPKFVMVQQNSIRDVRHEVVTHWDPHVTKDVAGRWVKVRRDGRSLFEEDSRQPFFMAEDNPVELRWPRGVYETPSHSWWYELHTTSETSGHFAYQRAMVMKTWLCRMVPVLERALPSLPNEALLWRLVCKETLDDLEPKKRSDYLTYDEALKALSFELPEGGSTLDIVATADFERAFFHPENIAERALVARTVEGFARLAEVNLSTERFEALVQEIVPNSSARQSHAFTARKFRDYVRDSIWARPIEVDTDDSAWLKLGLGWRKRKATEGGDIQGRQNCTAFLNATVIQLEDEVCADLRTLDRRAVIMFALNNHESAINDRDNWRRTAAAVLALHNDREATLDTMAEHDFALNAVFQASRLIVEFAICECPTDGGRKPGRLDMSRLMAKVLTIASLGGWSAAIHWQAMEPRLRVTPLGDIHANISFQEDVLGPYGRAGSDLTVEEAAKNYSKNLEDPAVKDTDESSFPAAFWAALKEETGASFDTTRKFLDELENLGIKRKRAIYVVKKSELLDVMGDVEGVGAADARQLIDFLTFSSRPRWRDVPEGYDERDRFPWRFRRRLTVLRKPLLQLSDEPDPDLIVTPGIARDAYVYMVRNYHQGDFPLWQLKPKMRAWSGRSRERIGHDFNEKVAARMRELGWKAETEVSVTKLLKKGKDQNFGDLKLYGDVDVLAWRELDSRVLLLECKDVQHRKIEGEIAEQMRDFRGEMRDGKPDLLLRHLRRSEVISAHPSEVAAYVGGTNPPHIEARLVFRYPVPMKFAWDRMEARIPLHLYSDLDQL